MKPIKNLAGEKIKHCFREDAGSIVVNDNSSYIKYLHDKKKTQEIDELKNKLADMEKMIQQLLEKTNG